MPLDYETLRIIWWLLIGILLIGFAIMDGFDLGVAMWLPWLGRTDIERRILINSIGPTWRVTRFGLYWAEALFLRLGLLSMPYLSQVFTWLCWLFFWR